MYHALMSQTLHVKSAYSVFGVMFMHELGIWHILYTLTPECILCNCNR